MVAYLLESSAAVKLYVREPGSSWLLTLVDPAQGHELFAARHGLRGYDCVQLAAALLVQQARRTAGLGSLSVISADVELNAAAQVEGFNVDNPNSHP